MSALISVRAMRIVYDLNILRIQRNEMVLCIYDSEIFFERGFS